MIPNVLLFLELNMEESQDVEDKLEFPTFKIYPTLFDLIETYIKCKTMLEGQQGEMITLKSPLILDDPTKKRSDSSAYYHRNITGINLYSHCSTGHGGVT